MAERAYEYEVTPCRGPSQLDYYLVIALHVFMFAANMPRTADPSQAPGPNSNVVNSHHRKRRPILIHLRLYSLMQSED